MVKIKRPWQHYDLVEVWWDDAAGLDGGWKARMDKLEPQMIVSVGFVVVDNEQYLIIAQDTDAEGSHNGRTQVPRGMVKNVRVLRKKDEKKEKKIEAASHSS